MSIGAQILVVIPVVAVCSVYSGWALLPAALRRQLAEAMVRLRWIGRLPAIVRAARAPTGCGCDGCDRSTTATSGTGDGKDGGASVIRIVPRRPTP